jgi:hypothetical protein
LDRRDRRLSTSTGSAPSARAQEVTRLTLGATSINPLIPSSFV